LTPNWIPPSLILEGRHVRLIPLQPGHSPELYRAGADPALWRFVPIRIDSQADMDQYVRTALTSRDTGDSQPFAVTGRSDGRILGSTRFYSMSRPNRNLEIGYTWLAPAVWRSPVNTECKFLLLRYAFETLGCLRVALRTDVRNLRSRAAIERLGARQEGILRKHMILPDGHVRDTVYYSITDEEWPAVKIGLEEKMAEKPDGGIDAAGA